MAISFPPFPSPISELEEFLLSPETIPIHDYRVNQRIWPRESKPESLLHAPLCGNDTDIAVERDLASGELLGFNEVMLEGIGLTSKNSTSLQRAPGPVEQSIQGIQDIQGDATHFPFWPGGLDEPETLKKLVEAEDDAIDYESTMSYNPRDEPTVLQLCTGLASVTNWQYLAIELPGIRMEHIGKIEINHRGDVDRQKMALFEKWLKVRPSATWGDVNGALMSIDEVSLATLLINQSVSDIGSSPMSLPHTPPSLQQQVLSPPLVHQHSEVAATEHTQQAVTPSKHEINIAEEDCVAETLMELYDMFVQIIFQVKTDFISLVIKQPAQLQSIIRFAEDAVSPSETVRFDVRDIEEFFRTLRPYYDFLECSAVTKIVKKFIDGQVLHDLQAHSSKAREFRRTAPIKQLVKDVRQVFKGFVSNFPTLDVKLETPWEEVVIEGLYVLIEHLLPHAVKKHPQYSLMNNIVIAEGCLLLQYAIRDPSMIDAIRQHVQHNIHFLRLMGVFKLAVDGRYAIFQDEDPSFSFNASLLGAVATSHNVAVQCLLDIGANVNNQDKNGFTPLMAAALYHNDVGVGILLAAGANADIANDGDGTALMAAVMVNDINIIHYLLEAGADVSIRDQNGNTALMRACGAGRMVPLPLGTHRLSDDYSDTVRLLLSHGAGVGVENNIGFTALMVAVRVNDIDVAEILLQAGTDASYKDSNGGTALMVACAAKVLPTEVRPLSGDYSKMVRLLLSHGADPVAGADIDGMLVTAFDVACILDNSDVVELLLTDCNIPPEAVVRGLYWALLNAAINTIKLLQSKIPDVDPLAIKLGVACVEGDTEAVKSLIDHGVDPSTSIVHGLTPLIIASRFGHIDVVDTLLLHGADINKADDIRGYTPLDHAKGDDIVSLLKLNGAKSGDVEATPTEDQDTPTGDQDTPTNESQGSPTARVGSFLSDLLNKLFLPSRKLKQQQRQRPHSNVTQHPIW